MKSKISLFLIIAIFTLCLSACSGTKEVEVSYEEGIETVRADKLFEKNSAEALKALCRVMSKNNDDPQKRDNFFYYMIIKVATIAENNEEDKYETALEVIDTCLTLPLTQAVVSDNMKKYYNIIDTRLTEKTKKYLIGKWKRADTTLMAGSTVEVTEGENGLVAKITGLPDSELKFKIGDIKWDNIQFANRKMFFFSDLSTEENEGIENYYKDAASAVYIYAGATGKINFDNNTIAIQYEKSDMTSGGTQLWVKMGTEHENLGFDVLAGVEQTEEKLEAHTITVPVEGTFEDTGF